MASLRTSKAKVAGKKRSTTHGTVAYWAPETFVEGIAETTDMWSLGCILYIMLTGCHPFDPEGTSTDEEMELAIKKANVSYAEKGG